MTTTVGIDLVTAVVRYLASQPSVVEWLGSSAGSPWIFADELHVDPSTQADKAAVVVRQHGGWTTPNVHNSAQFPRLHVELYALDKMDCHGTWTFVDHFLHRPEGDDQMWSSLRTIGCARLMEPQVERVRDSQLWRLWCQYGVVIG